MSTQAPSKSALATFSEGLAGAVAASFGDGMPGRAGAAMAETGAPPRAAQVPSHEDWEKLMGAIGDRLHQIWAVPALRQDAIVNEIFADLLYARNMPDLVADIDRLCDRVAHVLAHPEDFQPIEVRPANTEKALPTGRIRLRL